jgi:hypothetical protein
MKISKRTFTVGLMAVAGSPAWAQFGLPSLGGSKSSGGGDPRKIEADLTSINELTSRSLSKLAEALGLKETAAKSKKNADDIKSGNLGLADATGAVGEVSASVMADMEKKQKEGKKLDAASGAVATEALLPAIKAFPTWKSVADGVKSLDSTALMGAASLAQAAPKVPTAAKNTLDMSQAGISYLTFSGVDTTSIKKAAEANLKF